MDLQRGHVFQHPNMVQTFGYINASWTLRADLTAEWVCRVLNHMEEFGFEQATPVSLSCWRRPWRSVIGYMIFRRLHAAHDAQAARQGTQMPWVNPQNYRKDKKMFRGSAISDGP